MNYGHESALYAGDMNLNRKDEKKYAEIQTFNFLENKTVKNFFCSLNLL